ncbi:MAG: PQQ-dependent sugar dehydrogenase [Bryobacteraceae bacterium]
MPIVLRRVVLCLLSVFLLRAQDEIQFVPVATGITLPTDIQSPRDGSGRLFFTQQDGVIRAFRSGSLLAVPFLTLGAKTFPFNECGLLGLAFPPGFSTKQYFYVLYTNASCSTRILSRYRVSSNNPDVADPASEQVLLTLSQPASNHFGGQLRFGPDGYLYVSSGDGSAGGDPPGNAQNKSSLFGKIWRIDTESDLSQYRIPLGNPFAGLPGTRGEIWHFGLRNPWRFSFDRQTGDMWIGDVGQDRAEEVDFAPAGSSGLNFGWRTMEGLQCYPPGTATCNQAGLTAPVLEYAHDTGSRSIIGGFVYRGARFPGLQGTYIYGDFISSRFWGISRTGSTFNNRLVAQSLFSPTTFGEDEQGELYVAGYSSGAVYNIQPTFPAGPPVIVAPTPNQLISVAGVTFQWNAVTFATGYDLRILQGASTVFRGTLSGPGALSTLVSLPDGAYTFQVRGCTSGFLDSQCAGFASVNFSVSQTKPAARPTVTAPANTQTFTTSTQTFTWTSVSGASSYEILLTDMAAGGVPELSMSIGGLPPATSTVFSMRSSTDYRLQVRACTVACGPWSDTVAFRVTLPPVPTQALPPPACSLTGAVATCGWNPQTGADYYTLLAVQPSSGPGGGALTVAGLRTPQVSGALTLPPGAVSIFVAGCNGNGCGPYSTAANMTPAAASSAAPFIGSPVPGATIDGPDVFLSWNRVAGDNGSNTVYRLYVQDFSRGAPALDVLTTGNYWSAKFRGGGSRYDALVVVNGVNGPAAPFLVRSTSPASPTMAQPRHQTQDVTLSIAAGNVQLGWTALPGATLYEYLVSVQGQSQPVVHGVTPGQIVQVPLAASSTFYSGIVRACPAGQTCAFGSDAGWGPWSSAPGQGGVTNFKVQ